MRSEAQKYLLYAYGIFTAALAVCILLQPNGLTTNNGISYYGVHLKTLIPYAVGYVCASWFTLQASLSLRHSHYPFKVLRYLLLLSSLCMAILLFTPYTGGRLLADLHNLAGISLFSSQLLVVIWWLIIRRPSWFSFLTLAAMLTSGIECAIYLPAKTGYLIYFQAIYQLVFLAWIEHLLSSSEVSETVSSQALQMRLRQQ